MDHARGCAITCQDVFDGYMIPEDFTQFTMETKPGRRQPPLFELMGNVCLDFINTLDDRPSGAAQRIAQKLLRSRALRRRHGNPHTGAAWIFFIERVHLMPDEAQKALRRARNLREALYDIFSACAESANRTAARDGHAQCDISRCSAAFAAGAPKSRRQRGDGRLEWRFDDLTSALTQCCGRLRVRPRTCSPQASLALVPRLRFAHLPVVLSRHQQESPPPLVQHEAMRQSRKGAEVLCQEESPALDSTLQSRIHGYNRQNHFRRLS